MVDTGGLVVLAVIAIVIVIAAWRVRGQKYNGPPSVFDAADANTKALEENTKAIRELIAKMDERKP